MPIIEISLLEGRTKELKAELIKSVTDAVETTLAVKRDSIRVLLREIPPEHWGVGGTPKSRP